jgi:hypothetical protein
MTNKAVEVCVSHPAAQVYGAEECGLRHPINDIKLAGGMSRRQALSFCSRRTKASHPM